MLRRRDLPKFHREAWLALIHDIEEQARINIAVGHQVYEVPQLEHLELPDWNLLQVETGQHEVMVHLADPLPHRALVDPEYEPEAETTIRTATVKPVAYRRVTYALHPHETYWYGVGIHPEERVYLLFHGPSEKPVTREESEHGS